MPKPTVDISKYLSQNIHYPVNARRDNIEGQVIISFIVMEDGSLGAFTVIKGVRKDLDDEAIRAAKNMPKWKPALLDDKPVKVYFKLPITFQL